MSNLLDKASIILTPTAYNNGEALCVKPSDGSGDFDFSRNSAATRVNAQGLVENVQILSSNLVQNGDFSEEGAEEVSNGSFSQEGAEQITNGDFSNGSTDWILDSGWSVSDNKALCDGTNLAYITQTAVLTTGKSYKVQFDIVDYTSGSVKYRDNGFVSGQSFSGVGSYTDYVVAGGGQFRLMSENFIGSIDNVSVREVGQDWNLENTWTIGNSVANGNGAVGSTEELTQNNTFTLGKTYKVVYEILNYVSGNIQFQFSGGATLSGTTRSSDGTFTEYVVATANHTLLKFKAGSPFNGSITNISVKEVGQNWTIQSGTVNITDKAEFIGGGIIHQDALSVNTSYKVTYEVVSIVGVPVLNLYNGSWISAPSTVGTHTVYITMIAPRFYLRNLSNEITIDNISVIEITTDTSLPRINYEGFSYQDALGSEQIVNGGFDTNLNNWTDYGGTTISWESGGFALLDNDNGYWCKIRQSDVFEIGKTYRVILTAKSNIANKLFFSSTITGSFSQADTFETFEQYYTATTTTFEFGYHNVTGQNATITIDNVSIKEYLGQSVVPDSGCGSWLFESQSTNLITQSELFSDASWADVGLTINNNASVSPEGASNATKIIATTANSRHELKTSLATANGTDMVSCFVKKSGYNYVQIASWANPANYVNFDLTNGSVGSIGTTPPTNYGIKDYGNGWYRIYANVQASGGGLVGIGIVTSASAGWAQSFIGNGIDGIEIWGAQIEAGNISSYIPTSGSTVTRNQDVCNNGGSLASINSTEGVIYWEGAKLQEASGTQVLGLSDGSGANRIGFQTSPNVNQIRFVVDAGGNQASKFFVLDDITDFNKYALKWKQDDFSFWVNGIKIGTDTSGNVPPLNALNTLDFYYGTGNGTGIYNFTAKTKALAVWKEALSDEELIALTS